MVFGYTISYIGCSDFYFAIDDLQFWDNVISGPDNKYFDFAGYAVDFVTRIFIFYFCSSVKIFRLDSLCADMAFNFLFYKNYGNFFCAMDGQNNHKCFVDLDFWRIFYYRGRDLVLEQKVFSKICIKKCPTVDLVGLSS